MQPEALVELDERHERGGTTKGEQAGPDKWEEAKGITITNHFLQYRG